MEQQNAQQTLRCHTPRKWGTRHAVTSWFATFEHVKEFGTSTCRSLLLLPPLRGEKGGMRGARRESMLGRMSPGLRESMPSQSSRYDRNFALSARPPHPDHPPPERGERERAAASGIAEFPTGSFAGNGAAHSAVLLGLLLTLAITTIPAPAAGPVGGAHTQGRQAPGSEDETPEDRMNARFPQKVRVGDLIGIPVQDYDDRILGYVTDVVRKPDGKIVLVMPEGGWLWRAGRPAPIPIETVAILARHINLLDIPREDVPKLPTWDPAQGASIGRDDIIRIAISRR
jgi:hypothetical protein